MRRALLAIVVLAAACGQDKPDPPEIAQRKAECRQLFEHLFRISPQAQLQGLSEADQRKRIDELQARVPVEDIEQCAAADTHVIQCMRGAADTAAVKACVPPPK